MRSILSSESFSIRAPGDQSIQWHTQRDTLAKAMYEEATRRHPDGRPDVAENKSRIDAEMLITVSRTIADSQVKGAGERYILITSARRLRNLPKNIRGQLPETPEVLSLAEAATIASLLPEHPVSLHTLHALLFEAVVGPARKGMVSVIISFTRSVSCHAMAPNRSLNSLKMLESRSSSGSGTWPPPRGGTGSISAFSSGSRICCHLKHRRPGDRPASRRSRSGTT